MPSCVHVNQNLVKDRVLCLRRSRESFLQQVAPNADGDCPRRVEPEPEPARPETPSKGAEAALGLALGLEGAEPTLQIPVE